MKQISKSLLLFLGCFTLVLGFKMTAIHTQAATTSRPPTINSNYWFHWQRVKLVLPLTVHVTTWNLKNGKRTQPKNYTTKIIPSNQIVYLENLSPGSAQVAVMTCKPKSDDDFDLKQDLYIKPNQLPKMILSKPFKLLNYRQAATNHFTNRWHSGTFSDDQNISKRNPIQLFSHLATVKKI